MHACLHPVTTDKKELELVCPVVRLMRMYRMQCTPVNADLSSASHESRVVTLNWSGFL